jgi:hypothetical protein
MKNQPVLESLILTNRRSMRPFHPNRKSAFTIMKPHDF